MPTYLLHGFRWPRNLVRIHIILQNIDDAAAEWLVAPDTTPALLKNFHQLFPECVVHLPNLRFVEQYDPNDTSPNSVSQPYAYVADVVEEVRLGVDIDEVRGRGLNNEQWTAIMELRDKLAPEEKVGWYIVVCGDEERWAPPSSASREGSGNSQSLTPSQTEYPVVERPAGGQASSQSQKKKSSSGSSEPKEPSVLKKLFGSKGLGRKKR